MTPKRYIKFTARDAKGNLLPTPPEFEKLAEMWNSQDGVSDISEEIGVMVIDLPEDPDDPGDENDDPRGDEQP